MPDGKQAELFRHTTQLRGCEMIRAIQLTMVFAAVLVTAAVTSSSAFASITLQNSPSGGSISSFGTPDSMTYGQVFTAPVTGTLDSFTLYLNSGVGQLHGGVGTWNGPAAFGYNYGEASNLFTSASVSSNSGGPYTFAPSVNVVAGQQYVAYLSVFGDALANTTTSMPLGTNVTGIDYFVWNNSTDPKNNPSWNYFGDFGNAEFSATFSESAGQSAVPEASSLAIFFGIGACVAGMSWFRKKMEF